MFRKVLDTIKERLRGENLATTRKYWHRGLAKTTTNIWDGELKLLTVATKLSNLALCGSSGYTCTGAFRIHCVTVSMMATLNATVLAVLHCQKHEASWILPYTQSPVVVAHVPHCHNWKVSEWVILLKIKAA